VGWRLESSALSLFIFLCDFSVETWRVSSVKMYRCICKDWRFPLPWRNLLPCVEVSPRQRKLLMFSFTVLQMFLAFLLRPYALSSRKRDQNESCTLIERLTFITGAVLYVRTRCFYQSTVQFFLDFLKIFYINNLKSLQNL